MISVSPSTGSAQNGATETIPKGPEFCYPEGPSGILGFFWLCLWGTKRVAKTLARSSGWDASRGSPSEVASLMTTTECLVTEIPEENKGEWEKLFRACLKEFQCV